MLISAILALSPASDMQATTYKIVEIERRSAFAGKLGRRVHESLVLEKDGQRYTISVRGDYHTNCVRPWQRLKEGDEIKLGAPLTESATSVSREGIIRVRG